MSSDAPVYERGDALSAVSLRPGDEATVAGEPVRSQEVLDSLTKDQYWTWLESLLDEGVELDRHLDALLDEVYRCQPHFYSWAGRQELRTVLGELHDLREDIRAYEQDVEQLWYAFAKSSVVDVSAAQNADLTLESVKRTYDRAYDLCLYKFDRMADNWVTATNLLISVTILVVTILFWMEFR